MRFLRAHKAREQDSGGLDIVKKSPLTSDKPRVFQPRNARANKFWIGRINFHATDPLRWRASIARFTALTMLW
jgi:hypothetical protein